MNQLLNRNFGLLVFVICVILLLAGCQSLATFHLGQHVLPADSTPLQAGGPHQGVSDNFEMVIPYTYEYRDNSLEIASAARLGEHYRSLYSRLNRLDIYLYFLDADYAVIATALLANAASLAVEDQIDFKRRLAVPPRTTAFSFGYQGQVSELEDFATFDKRPYR